MKSIPLYLHIPFCQSRCAYCNFYSTTPLDPKTEERFIDKLIKQIKYQMSLTGADCFKTIYIGGGTPSGLSIDSLQRLLHFLESGVNSHTLEISMECNPENITEELIDLLNKSPVNRLSLGVQSFNERILAESGRRTTSNQIVTALSILKKEWIGRLNIDMITGLPGQDKSGQLLDMEKAVESGAGHISCYSLIVEENSRIAAHPLLPDGEEEDILWKISRDYLIEKGFNQYEVSNFCNEGEESLHNLEYWRMNEYLGCGPGAVGMYRDKDILRINNPPDIKLWWKGQSENWNISVEKVADRDFLFENFMMGLRTAEGMDRNTFSSRFGINPEEVISSTIERSPKNTFTNNGKNLSLSPEAMLFMNPILIRISEEIETKDFDFQVRWP